MNSKTTVSCSTASSLSLFPHLSHLDGWRSKMNHHLWLLFVKCSIYPKTFLVWFCPLFLLLRLDEALTLFLLEEAGGPTETTGSLSPGLWWDFFFICSHLSTVNCGLPSSVGLEVEPEAALLVWGPQPFCLWDVPLLDSNWCLPFLCSVSHLVKVWVHDLLGCDHLQIIADNLEA